ncbi:hypothetical protein [Magnetospira sp. QH-2]|uniref:hypothetical protein n=1 Tax=Magnetospira sp. (strain QH-2) TaxID=1288970 RepID=UPI0003E81AE1|nr:hypothetical protein [Magnetospira sp. QH-2]CCQ74729.1 conserved protein of unknown function [Magnetospira sp. QH-2]
MGEGGLLKRGSWLDLFRDKNAGQAATEELKNQRAAQLDELIYGQWNLGHNMVIAWCPAPKALDMVVVPHYRIAEVVAGMGDPIADAMGDGATSALERILSGAKQAEKGRLEAIAELFESRVMRLDLPFTPGEDLPLDTVDSLVRRYSISLVEDRAVALFDAVGFSLVSPFEQVTQLNSLSYSVNAAYSKLLEKNIEIKFARSTTGDGYYIWNRISSMRANLDLYHFMHLVMADNAIARVKSSGKTVPYLRTCFHVGSHYEFYQAEGLNPTAVSYIVGDVTIVLARMISSALPGQVLIGDFLAPMTDKTTGRTHRIDALEFIQKAEATISNLEGLVLSGDEVESIRCYLTGPKYDDGSFGISRFTIHDKHGQAHQVFNAKVNIHRRNAPPIFLGLQHGDLEEFRERADEEIIHFSSNGERLD